MYLLVDIDKCTGCRTCELACSFRWSKTFQPSEAAITVVKYEQKSINIPVVCQQCSKPVCVDVCISGAISRDSQTGIVTIDEFKCRGCKTCITSCPFGAIVYVSSSSIARKCDLCISVKKKNYLKTNYRWETECSRTCPYNAIEILSEEKISQKLKRKKSKYYEILILQKISQS